MLNFSKMHSLGNDFMVVDGVTKSVQLDPEQIALWGNRQRDIGFDQLLLVAPPSTPVCDFEKVLFNADGSEAEQCGVRGHIERPVGALAPVWDELSSPRGRRLASRRLASLFIRLTNPFGARD